jgi:hypothetical protein
VAGGSWLEQADSMPTAISSIAATLVRWMRAFIAFFLRW